MPRQKWVSRVLCREYRTWVSRVGRDGISSDKYRKYIFRGTTRRDCRTKYHVWNVCVSSETPSEISRVKHRRESRANIARKISLEMPILCVAAMKHRPSDAKVDILGNESPGGANESPSISTVWSSSRWVLRVPLAGKQVSEYNNIAEQYRSCHFAR